MYLVGAHEGDDMCGGLVLVGVASSAEAAVQMQEDALAAGDGQFDIIPVPLDIRGWLGYTSLEFAVGE